MPGHDELKRIASPLSCPGRTCMPSCPALCRHPRLNDLDADVARTYFDETMHEHRRLTDAAALSQFHHLRTEVPFFVFAQTAVMRTQVFVRGAAQA